MKSKHVFQIFVLLAMLLGMMGGQSAYAQPASDIIIREMTYWNATYVGYVDANRFEKWPFVFTESYEFTMTVTPTSGDLAPLLLLLDVGGAELARGAGILTSSLPAGSYFVQVQPESGSGFYDLMLRQVDQVLTTISTSIAPESLTVGESALVSISLNEVPVDGYTSIEFTCTYPVDMVSVSNILVTDLFGTDPAIAINDPQNGSFIVAIAGSNGQKAMAPGVAFSFNLASLLVGQADIVCTAKASTGDGVLVELTSTVATLIINDVIPEGTLTGQVIADKPVIINLYNLDDTLALTLSAELDGTFTLTAPAGSYNVEAEAGGYLSARGAASIADGQNSTMTTINLTPGDIDGNGVIDQFDAMTIGMSYNTAVPDAADLNGDGIINVLDLEIVAANYNAVGPTAW
jgi:hypothetical protein